MLRSSLAWSPNAINVIQQIVRSAGSSKVPTKKIEVTRGKSNAEVVQWVSQNRGSLEGTLGGPFDPTPQYASTYVAEAIFVHVLDWAGKDNLLLPAIIDRPVLNARLFRGPPVRVDQHPWGTSIVVPENERPNDVDTIVELTVANPRELVQPRTVDDSKGGMLLQGDNAKLNGALQYNPGPDWIQDWTSVDDSLSWQVRAPVSSDYEVAITYSCAPGCGGAQFEIIAGRHKVIGTLRETTGVFGDWLNFEKQNIDGHLHLNAGINRITLHAVSKSKTNEILRLYGLYLLPRNEKEELASASRRAQIERTPADWLSSSKYGIMVHWIAATMPRSGPPQPFCDSVQKFDVEHFADTIKETGAAYLIFTLAHGVQKFPVPLKSVDTVLRGRTCIRDLPADLADALSRRSIKLILYYHHGVGDAEWSKASGFLKKDKSAFFGHESAILTEVGQRYGTKLAGWWFDDRYPLQPFEQLDHSAKVGNPERIVAFNSWVMPRSTDFQDYWAGEVAGALLSLPPQGYFDHGGPQNGLQPHVLILLDDPWVHGMPDTPIHDPIFDNQRLIEYVRDCNQKGAAVTMNIGVYEDGTVSPATLKQLQDLRSGVRGY